MCALNLFLEVLDLVSVFFSDDDESSN